MTWVELIADRKIREASDDGAFDNLPGRGRPLNLEMDLRVPPEQRMAMRLLREANFVPDWIETAREVRRATERFSRRVEQFARARLGNRLAGRRR